jgi:superfamily I DNA/RNA helicase/mRNA-degrading endonuclease YafQ of YafQ-DinJ toxin-antitoxin module
MVTESALVCTDDFVDALGRMSAADRDHVRETIATLLRDPRHTGLNAHRLQKGSEAWECYANYHIRLIYMPAHDAAPLRLWYVGQHQMVDKGRLSFVSSKRFIPVPPDIAPVQAPAETPAGDVPTFIPDAEWFLPPAEDDGDLSEIADPAPLAHYPAMYLRFLGVPGTLVFAVQSAPTQDAILALPGLPEHTQTILLDLFTNPRLAQVLFDPSRLLYRATLDSIEGFCEGRIKKLMLNLTAQQERCVGYDQPGAVVLRGVAGSGKTTVGLYRAIARARAGRRVLLLTYNTTLVAALESLVRELAGEIPPNLTIQTVDGCLWHATTVIVGRTLANTIARDADQHQCFAAAVRQVPGAAELARREGGKFFENEITTIIQARGLFDQEAYRAAPRTGRGIAIGKVQRLIVWEVYQAYRAQLRQRNLNDFHEIAHAIISAQSLPANVQYDDIIIDETQDITLLKLRAVARLLAPEDAAPTLWLLCDSAQTIYSRMAWWQEGDLPQPPHRLYLRRNHRNTLQIATAAAHLATHNTLRERDMASIKPERATHMGATPQVIACTSREQQEQWIVDRLQSLCDGTDFRYSDFAVLCQTNDDCRHVGATISGVGIPVSTPETRLDLLENTVKVLTCYSAKGLEFPVVFLFNAVQGQVPHRAALQGLEGEDLAREIERARALFYVAMTRAADMLYILTDVAHPSPFLAELGDTVQRETLAGA